MSLRPVFIGGCPRSGTTLLASMIGLSPFCLVTPESQFKISLLDTKGYPSERASGPRLAEYLKKSWRFGLWRIDPRDIEPKVNGGIRPVREVLEWAVQQYGNLMGKTNAGHWIDHTPSNLRWHRRLLSAFPDAKFIHLVRDGRGVISSVLPLDWRPKSVITGARWWLGELAAGLGAEIDLGSEGILRLRFEDLLANPTQTLNRAAHFLDLLPFHARLIWDGFTPPAYSQSQHSLIGQPLDYERADAWVMALSEREIELVEYLAGDLLMVLGYPSVLSENARAPTWGEELVTIWEEFSRFFPNRISRRLRRRQIRWSRRS